MHLQTYTDPKKQLIMLEVVEGPSVRFIYFINIFFYLYLTILLTLLKNLQLSVLSAE